VSLIISLEQDCFLSPSLMITCHPVDQIDLAESGLEIWFPLVMLYVRVCRFGPLTRTSTSVGVMMSEPMPIDPAPAAPLMMFAIPGFGRMMAAGTETTIKVSRSSTSTNEGWRLPSCCSKLRSIIASLPSARMTFKAGEWSPVRGWKKKSPAFSVLKLTLENGVSKFILRLWVTGFYG
jgi:hypothetical protein